MPASSVSKRKRAVGLTGRIAARHKRPLTGSSDTLNALYDLAGGLDRWASEAGVGSSALEGALSLLDAIDCIDHGFALYDANDALFIHNRRYRRMHASVEHLIAPGARYEDLVRAGLHSGDGSLVVPSETEVQEHLARHAAADGAPEIRMRGQTWLMLRERRTRLGGIVVIETDITELKTANIAKDEFLAKISHELRTPITPIHGALSLIASGRIATLPPSLSELVEVARRNCAKLITIVNELFDFTWVSSGRFSLNRRLIEAIPFIEQTVRNKRIGPNPPDITLSVGADISDAKLEVDPLRIRQVLDNLLSNAIKFTDLGARIDVIAEGRNGRLRISVVDFGPGIPSEFQARVFEAFAQADSSSARRQGGVGLGLSISKSIVEAHGGAIGFTSSEGEGTTFFFELPIAGEQEKEVSTRTRKPGARRRAKTAPCRPSS